MNQFGSAADKEYITGSKDCIKNLMMRSEIIGNGFMDKNT